MNLSAYEFIDCQAEKQSPLILSEFAGKINRPHPATYLS